MTVGKAKIRLLLVDDEVGYLEVLSKRLGKRNLDVTTANSGQQGIQLLRRNDFDVAVVDLKLTDMDGIDVLKIFKKMDPDLSVIILTGHGSEQAAREGIEKGAFDYLTKPFDPDELKLVVERALERRRLLQENIHLKTEVSSKYRFENVVGASPGARSWATSSPRRDAAMRLP